MVSKTVKRMASVKAHRKERRMVSMKALMRD